MHTWRTHRELSYFYNVSTTLFLFFPSFCDFCWSFFSLEVKHLYSYCSSVARNIFILEACMGLCASLDVCPFLFLLLLVSTRCSLLPLEFLFWYSLCCFLPRLKFAATRIPFFPSSSNLRNFFSSPVSSCCVNRSHRLILQLETLSCQLIGRDQTFHVVEHREIRISLVHERNSNFSQNDSDFS